MRSIDEILKEADENKDNYRVIKRLWMEISLTVLQRDPRHSVFAREHLLPMLKNNVISSLKKIMSIGE